MNQLVLTPSMLFVGENKRAQKNLIDGNPRTKWVGAQTPSFFEVRFETLHKINRIVLTVPKNIYCIFSVFASEDNVNYHEVLRQESEKISSVYDPERHPRYDNFDAINISRYTDIPVDYDGVMGVPVTYLRYHDPARFEIIGQANHGTADDKWDLFKPVLNGREQFKRILIKRVTVRRTEP